MLKPATVKLLKRVRQHILDDPARLEMSEWAQHSDRTPCGTVGCIAGWATILTKVPNLKKLPKLYFDVNPTHLKNTIEVSSFTGMIALKLPSEQADKLFYLHNWPRRFHLAFSRADSREEKAEVTADRIANFIITDGKE
jgi:hypothetical protein